MKLATLLYITNNEGEFLLIERAKNPNRGLLSPPGGKLKTSPPESPFACAVREAFEECGIVSDTGDWKLKGIVTENEYPDTGNIMIFLLFYTKTVNDLPPPVIEGKFLFLSPEKIMDSRIPLTDKLYIWKFVLENNEKIFSICIDCSKNPYVLKIE